MDGVARRAGVGKATVYRRWNTKEELLVEVLGDTDPRLLPLHDHGSEPADVAGVLADVVDQLWFPAAIAWRRVFPGLLPADGLALSLPSDPLPAAGEAHQGRREPRPEPRREQRRRRPGARSSASYSTIVHAWFVGNDVHSGYDLAAVLVRPRLTGPSSLAADAPH